MSSMHLSYRRNHWLTKPSTKYCGKRKKLKLLCSEQHACVTSKKIGVQLSASAIAKVTHVAKAGRTQCMRVTDVRHADKYARSMDVLGFVDAKSRCTLITAVMHTVTASITVTGIRGSDARPCLLPSSGSCYPLYSGERSRIPGFRGSVASLIFGRPHSMLSIFHCQSLMFTSAIALFFSLGKVQLGPLIMLACTCGYVISNGYCTCSYIIIGQHHLGGARTV
jgi:hypothetical protein